uniref:(California timema) hypothetical protein n=1 Tax=Timema californicum TaxID=61474 RepID=A0A7R9JI45_TIMCA|nr:unnamed protein product [Timema californicum]
MIRGNVRNCIGQVEEPPWYVCGIHEPCYINVLSWGKISVPRRQDDPVPLYGGMRIPQSNLMANNKRVVIPRRPPIIFAVMINPQILKDSGKSAPDPSALVELVLDFVEGMNPDIQFKRSYQVLQERDLTGELKDIWLAIQLKRERDRANLHKTVLIAEDQPTVTYCHHVNNKHTEQKEFSLSSSDSSEDEDRSERASLVQTVDNINSSNERRHFCNTSSSKRLSDNVINQPVVPSAPRKVCHCIVSTDTTLRDENVANNSQFSSPTVEYPNHPIPVECPSSLRVLAASSPAKDICDKQPNEPHINETSLVKSEMGKAIKLKV